MVACTVCVCRPYYGDAEDDEEDSKENGFNKVLLVWLWNSEKRRSACVVSLFMWWLCTPEACPVLGASWAEPTLFSLGAVAVLSSLLPWDSPQKGIYY